MLRRALIVLLVVGLAGLVWVRFVREVEDPYACGPKELTTPPLGEPESPPPAVSLDEVLGDASAVAAVERPDGRLLVLTRGGELIQVPRAGGASEVLHRLEPIDIRGESGGLGLALSPDDRHLYLSYSPNDEEAELVEFELTDDGIDVDSRRTVTTEPNPRGHHLMANLVFGPDGFLYVGAGDRGNPAERAGQPSPVAQDLSDRGGKIWRIDPRPDGDEPYAVPSSNPFVDRDAAAPEVFLYGFRNPWRFSFDRETGDLWIADAGEYCAEEITRLPAGHIAGANLGWNVYEGALRFDEDSEAPGSVAPLYTYPRAFGDEEAGEPTRCAVIGGHVYRGSSIPELEGSYVFGDFCTGLIEVLDVRDDGAVVVQTLTELPRVALQAMAEGRDGELYALTTGGVFALEPG